jgi:hypothetical protein
VRSISWPKERGVPVTQKILCVQAVQTDPRPKIFVAAISRLCAQSISIRQSAKWFTLRIVSMSITEKLKLVNNLPRAGMARGGICCDD